jgi:hypothetical protein
MYKELMQEAEKKKKLSEQVSSFKIKLEQAKSDVKEKAEKSRLMKRRIEVIQFVSFTLIHFVY